MTYLRTLAIDEALTWTAGTDVVHSLGEALGGTLVLTDATGTPTTAYTYAPFGETTATGAPSANPVQFTGRENDGTGLYYYRARYYDPIRSRFVQEDPLGLAAGINRYLFTFNNPLSWVDRTGLDVTVIHYVGVSGNPAGHIGINVNDGPSVGFDPVWWSIPWVPFGYPVPGTVDAIAPNRGIRDQITIRTTPEQDQQILQFIKQRQRHPGLYSLFGRNCAQFATGALRSAGLKAPSDVAPSSLLQDLHRLYDPALPPNAFTQAPIGDGLYVDAPIFSH